MPFKKVISPERRRQAARVSDYTAFFNLDDSGNRTGILDEFGDTIKIFTNPEKKSTEDYITGRFG